MLYAGTFYYRYLSRKAERSVMANISVVGRIVSDDIELKISANNRPYLRFDLAERTGKGAYARTQYYQVVAFGAKLEEKFSCPRNEWLFLLSI